LFNTDLGRLIAGEKIEKIEFNFINGKRVYTNQYFSINENQPIIIEGIHGLNPTLTSQIKDEDKFKIYISALTQLNLDETNRVSTTDLRLIRRIVRDNKYRAYSAEKTILQWNFVRQGEEKNIYPYQEEADVMFNSACLYELAVLKVLVEPLLLEIPLDSKAQVEAMRLMAFLQYFVGLEDTSDISKTSILREFIGGSKLL
jgi:uridine kinase